MIEEREILEELVKDLLVNVLGLTNDISKVMMLELEKEIGKKYQTLDEAVLKYCVNTSIAKVFTDVERILTDETTPVEEMHEQFRTDFKNLIKFYDEILMPTIEDMLPSILDRSKQLRKVFTKIQKKAESKKLDVEGIKSDIESFLSGR